MVRLFFIITLRENPIRHQSVVVHQVLPKLIGLWGLNVKTDVEAKKTSFHRTGNDNAPVSAPLRTDRHPHQ